MTNSDSIVAVTGGETSEATAAPQNETSSCLINSLGGFQEQSGAVSRKIII